MDFVFFDSYEEVWISARSLVVSFAGGFWFFLGLDGSWSLRSMGTLWWESSRLSSSVLFFWLGFRSESLIAVVICLGGNFESC